MRAMILAAGFGTRLRPLTETTPKALVPFKGVPLVERIIRNLVSAGITRIIVNVHHHAGQVIEFLGKLDIPGTGIAVSDERRQLMDTGGALLQAREFLKGEDPPGRKRYPDQGQDDFLVHNVDVLTNLDIPTLIDAHRKGNALATIAVKKRPTSRSLLFDREGFLCGWRHNETGEQRSVREARGDLGDYGNSCIQVIRNEFLDHFPDTKPMELTRMYLDLAGKHRVQPYIHNDDYWYDLGRYENYLKADKEVF
jgi:NDP-sugar pyrophosphorylase family protein